MISRSTRGPAPAWLALALLALLSATAAAGDYLPPQSPPERAPVWTPRPFESARTVWKPRHEHSYAPNIWNPARTSSYTLMVPLDSDGRPTRVVSMYSREATALRPAAQPAPVTARHAASRASRVRRGDGPVAAAIRVTDEPQPPFPQDAIAALGLKWMLATAPTGSPRTAPAPLRFAAPKSPLAWLFTRTSGPRAGSFDLLAPIAKATYYFAHALPDARRIVINPNVPPTQIAPDNLAFMPSEPRHRSRKRPTFLVAPRSLLRASELGTVVHGAAPAYVPGLPPLDYAALPPRAVSTVAPALPPIRIPQAAAPAPAGTLGLSGAAAPAAPSPYATITRARSGSSSVVGPPVAPAEATPPPVALTARLAAASASVASAVPLAPHAAHAHHTEPDAAATRAVSPISRDLLEPIVKRATELRDQLMTNPAARTPAQLAAFESALGQFEDHLRGGNVIESWGHAFATKGRLFLALIDRANARQHLAIGQAWLDALCPEAEPMVFRNVGGVRVITRGDASRPEIALTFDGGPGPDTAALLDYLKSENVRGTWFLLGCFAEKDPATSHRIADEGHVIANHTMTHAKWKGLAKISAQVGAWEIEEGQRVIAAATGVTKMDLFRPPYGSGAELEWVNRVIARQHRYSIMWTIDSLDSMGAGFEKQVRRVLTSPKLNGAIVLSHDHSKTILPLMKTIIPELKRRGYRFVTVPELLIAGEQRLRGERFAELCVSLQEGRVGACFMGSQRAAALGRHDALGAEMADLAAMVQRLYPNECAAAQAQAAAQAAAAGPPPAPAANR